MTLPGLPVLRRRPKGVGLAVLFYLVSALLMPLMHADTERLADTAAFEAHHSLHCFPIHDEAVCPTCGAHQSIAAPVAVSLAFAFDAGPTNLLPAEAVAPPSPQVSPPAARAPPRH